MTGSGPAALLWQAGRRRRRGPGAAAAQREGAIEETRNYAVTLPLVGGTSVRCTLSLALADPQVIDSLTFTRLLRHCTNHEGASDRCMK